MEEGVTPVALGACSRLNAWRPFLGKQSVWNAKLESRWLLDAMFVCALWRAEGCKSMCWFVSFAKVDSSRWWRCLHRFVFQLESINHSQIFWWILNSVRNICPFIPSAVEHRFSPSQTFFWVRPLLISPTETDCFTVRRISHWSMLWPWSFVLSSFRLPPVRWTLTLTRPCVCCVFSQGILVRVKCVCVCLLERERMCECARHQTVKSDLTVTMQLLYHYTHTHTLSHT